MWRYAINMISLSLSLCVYIHIYIYICICVYIYIYNNTSTLMRARVSTSHCKPMWASKPARLGLPTQVSMAMQHCRQRLLRKSKPCPSTKVFWIVASRVWCIIYIHIHTHTHIHVHMHWNIIYIYICICICMYVCMYVCIYIYIYIYNSQPLQRVLGIPPTAKPCHRRNPSEIRLHPIPITRFRSFRTQPLESLSAAVKLPIKQGFWATQPSATSLVREILWWELGVEPPSTAKIYPYAPIV